jgi:hypothetical protein
MFHYLHYAFFANFKLAVITFAKVLFSWKGEARIFIKRTKIQQFHPLPLRKETDQEKRERLP